MYLAFLLFELTVGMFYPSYGSIKSQNIPEEVRSGVMNIFRIPLNGTHCTAHRRRAYVCLAC